jgi:nitric oxide reductase large subunit
MKYKLFLLIWLIMLSFLSLVVGILAYIDYPGAEIAFWSGSKIDSKSGKITWIVISAACLVTFSCLIFTFNRKSQE